MQKQGWAEKMSKVLKRTTSKIIDMANSEDSSMSTLTVETLLSRWLNDVEQKFAPKILYVKGSIPTPLPKSGLSIVGSRKASANGLHRVSRSCDKHMCSMPKHYVCVPKILIVRIDHRNGKYSAGYCSNSSQLRRTYPTGPCIAQAPAECGRSLTTIKKEIVKII